MISRAERSQLARWWWTVDQWQIGAFLVLMALGLILSMAGSPPVAERIGLPPFHFVHRQAMYLVPAIIIMLGVSTLDPRQVRRASLVTYAGAMLAILLALKFGHEIKGARRWIFGIQPSEFLKPAFVVLAAWAFSEGAKQKKMPGTTIAILLLPLTVIPLLLQPDFGQTMLISLVWAALFLVAGVHILWIVGIGGLGAIGVLLAYKLSPHVHQRIISFLDPQAAHLGTNAFQVETALDSFYSGGWLGRGPGGGVIKRILPDSHTDFIFAVTGEEFGILFCIALMALFAFVVLRGLRRASRDEDPFCRFAATGLLVQFGLQSCINMAVNLDLMPAKGMTLPFISYGGSSLMALALGAGFLIAVTRKRPRSEVLLETEVPAGLPA
ncbi:MAG: putative lipid II flippase FtsW [Hyphomicrobiales bacterium]|nr:putative lipid II flippase FtsW [Hyphomicrobiales bacterium]